MKKISFKGVAARQKRRDSIKKKDALAVLHNIITEASGKVELDPETLALSDMASLGQPPQVGTCLSPGLAARRQGRRDRSKPTTPWYVVG